MKLSFSSLVPLAGAITVLGLTGAAQASSHREAPFILTEPKVDGTDFYMFNSYETGRVGFVTIVANYEPLQDPFGGPNYFWLDPNALYEINIDNNGDAKEDITFQFRFGNHLAGGSGVTLPIGGMNVAIPLVQAGPVAKVNDKDLNVSQTFSVAVVRGGSRSGNRQPVTDARAGGAIFYKPVDNIGTKTIADYAGYAAQFIYTINIPGCPTPGRMFVGQRQDPFAVNLGAIFDLVNIPLSVLTDPTQINSQTDALDGKNVTTIALEVAQGCLTAGGQPIIGGWTVASLHRTRLLDPAPPAGLQTTEKVAGDWVQVSRLGMPLVNEVVIGLKDKDRFNASAPSGDGQFLSYVTNPTLPQLLSIVLNLPNVAPTNFPRNDLVTTFLTGIPGLNQPPNVVPSEELRLNTSIPAVPFAQQNRLGVLGNILAGGTDFAGYPNGRRPKDDVVDISLVAMMGGLCLANGTTNALGFGAACNPSVVPLGTTAYNLNDGVDQAQRPFLPTFPYLNTPLPGAQ